MLHYLDYSTDDLVTWFAWLVLAVVLALSTADPCEDLTRGTDAYFECITGAELDLTPTGGS